jgi:phosphoribosylformimino-5-aminoimidazole carboxamide ribonucleotide (ProFAR) isomerase
MDTPPAETRTKPVRITVDLAPADYQALNRWVAKAAIELDQPMSRLSQAQVIRALIRAAAADGVVSGVVLDLLRREREQA